MAFLEYLDAYAADPSGPTPGTSIIFSLGWDETATTTSTVVDVGGSPTRDAFFTYAMTPAAGTSTILQQHG
jgi:hypothetical protein